IRSDRQRQAKGSDTWRGQVCAPTGRVYRKDRASRWLCPLPLRGDTRPNGLLGPREAKGEEGEGSISPQVTVRVSALRGGRHCRDRGGGTGVTVAAGAFSRGVGGNAESRICHYFSPLPSPPGAKAKAKANATLGTARPGSCTLHLLPERPASALAGSRAPQPARARKVAGEGAAEGKAMACLRLRGCRISDFSGLLLLLLLWPPVTPGTTCSTPKSIEHADIHVKSYNENSRERYICNSGFKRKAGTSSLTKCQRDEVTNITQWTTPTLKCIMSVSIPVAVLCGVCVVFLVAHYAKSRQTPRTPSVEMENTEDMPMTGGTSGRQDTENYPMA
uniref:Sushi domain-containing protein n=1 Tax=Rhinolophus ferrumequinum TaxID=59479 RepID=A0A671FNC9_RHIFE